jgi:hypothetical protein
MITCLIVRNITVGDEDEGKRVRQGLEFEEMGDSISMEV